MSEEKSNEEAQDQVEIEEVTEEVVDEGFDIEGLSDGELEMAKDQGLIKEGDGEDDGDVEKDETVEKDEKKEEVVENENPTFEDAEKDEKLVDRYNKNEKALYWKWKTDKHKRQEAQNDLKELRDSVKDLKGGVGSNKKLDAISKLLTEDQDSLTIEELQRIINETVEEVKEDVVKPEVVAEKQTTRLDFTEKIGRAKYDKFDEYAQLAKEVAAKSKVHSKAIFELISDDSVDESLLVEELVSLAKLHPKFKEVTDSVDPEDKKKVDRVVKNSKKKVSSAAISGSKGRRIISEDELTCEQAERLPQAKWDKLKQSTRTRVMKGIDPK